MFFDNFKGLLIVLVVFGHIIGPLIHQAIILKALYIFVYSFHVPAIVFVCGYFSRNDKPVKRQILKFAFLFVLLEAIYRLLYFWLFGRPMLHNLFIPTWTLWFLASLITWRLVLRILNPSDRTLKYWILGSVFIGLVCGSIPGISYPASASRSIVFFPFFLLGYRYKAVKFPIAAIHKQTALFLLLPLLTISFLIAPRFDVRWFYGSCSYCTLGIDLLSGCTLRAALYIFASIIGLAAMQLTGNSSTPLTAIGRHSLSIFLIHGIPVKLLHYGLS